MVQNLYLRFVLCGLISSTLIFSQTSMADNNASIRGQVTDIMAIEPQDFHVAHEDVPTAEFINDSTFLSVENAENHNAQMYLSSFDEDHENTALAAYNDYRQLQTNIVTLCDYSSATAGSTKNYCTGFPRTTMNKYLQFNSFSVQKGYLLVNPKATGASFYLQFGGCADGRGYESMTVDLMAPSASTTIKVDVGVSTTGCVQKSATIYTSTTTIPKSSTYMRLTVPMSIFATMDMSKMFTIGFTAGINVQLRILNIRMIKSTSAPVTPPVAAPVAAPTTQTGNAWLTAHNTRRQKYHAKYGKTYVPLKWSTTIAQSAQGYANKLIALSGCQIQHGYQGDSYGGENLYANWGSGSVSAATPDQVLQAWTENEEPSGSTMVFSNSGHFTQVIWRGTRYVGCAVASKSGCFVQVCRYIAPGNCNLNTSNWPASTLADSSPCGPQCPSEGCI